MKNLLLLLYFEFVSLINIYTTFPFIYIIKKYNPKICYFLYNSYLYSLLFIVKWTYNCKIYLKNEELIYDFNKNDNIRLLVQNHQTEFDFLFGYIFFGFIDISKINLRMIMTKKIYYYLPGIGLGNFLLEGILINDNRNKKK